MLCLCVTVREYQSSCFSVGSVKILLFPHLKTVTQSKLYILQEVTRQQHKDHLGVAMTNITSHLFHKLWLTPEHRIAEVPLSRQTTLSCQPSSSINGF